MDLEGKNVLVTGANTGIGRITAIDLAKRHAKVILACRSEERARPVLDEIAAAGGNAEYMHLDLADLASVRASASAFLARHEPLSILVNNAGLAGAHGLTKDGFEIAFGTNHVGPYLFTRLLLPALERAGEIHCATSDEVGGHTGRYYDACREKTPSRMARDEALARELWERSAAYVGLAA